MAANLSSLIALGVMEKFADKDVTCMKIVKKACCSAIPNESIPLIRSMDYLILVLMCYLLNEDCPPALESFPCPSSSVKGV